MKGYFLPDYNIALQVTNKTGSLQMINTFILFFNYHNIKYQELDISFNIFDEKTQFYIFTRNPIDRFITTYNWFMTSINGPDVVLNLKKKYNIPDIESYINNYDKIMYEIDDTHYQPQIFEILAFEPNNFNFDSKSIKDSLFKRYNTNYTFLNMEMISTFLEKFSNTYQHSNGNELDKLLPETEYKSTLILDLIPEFASMDIELKKHFNFLYIAIKSILDKNHHNSTIRIELDTTKLRSIIGKIPILKIEAALYGYSLPTSII
jgi:hypothetical protein